MPDTLRFDARSVLMTAAMDGGSEGSSSPPITTPGSKLTILI
jgi:hypothetical protein